MNDYTIETIGGICKAYRISNRIKQSEVAESVGCSIENVSSFENGRNNNCRIFLWYLAHGLDYKTIDRLAEEWS